MKILRWSKCLVQWLSLTFDHKPVTTDFFLNIDAHRKNNLRGNPLARNPWQVIHPSDLINVTGTCQNGQVNFILQYIHGLHIHDRHVIFKRNDDIFRIFLTMCFPKHVTYLCTMYWHKNEWRKHINSAPFVQIRVPDFSRGITNNLETYRKFQWMCTLKNGPEISQRNDTMKKTYSKRWRKKSR
jgi:hypothetical protein